MVKTSLNYSPSSFKKASNVEEISYICYFVKCSLRFDLYIHLLVALGADLPSLKSSSVPPKLKQGQSIPSHWSGVQVITLYLQKWGSATRPWQRKWYSVHGNLFFLYYWPNLEHRLFLTKYTPELLTLMFWLLRLFWLCVFSASLRRNNEEGQK